jgi:hypothetical protein
MDDSFQPTIDMLLNVAVFIWFGAICPWSEFYHNSVIPLWRLVLLGILVLLLRRPPIVFALHKQIPQIEQKRQALFVGFFGPIGVSAIFYLYVSLEFLGQIKTADGSSVRPDAKYLMEVMNVVIWFLCICSVVIHGLSIPMAKLGFFIPRTLSQALSSAYSDPEPFHVQTDADTDTDDVMTDADAEQRLRRRPGWSRGAPDTLPRRVVRIGRSIIRAGGEASAGQSTASLQVAVPLEGAPEGVRAGGLDGGLRRGEDGAIQRTIRFPDEAPVAARAE